MYTNTSTYTHSLCVSVTQVYATVKYARHVSLPNLILLKEILTTLHVEEGEEGRRKLEFLLSSEIYLYIK